MGNNEPAVDQSDLRICASYGLNIDIRRAVRCTCTWRRLCACAILTPRTGIPYRGICTPVRRTYIRTDIGIAVIVSGLLKIPFLLLVSIQPDYY